MSLKRPFFHNLFKPKPVSRPRNYASNPTALEVERKFLPTQTSINLLRTNTGIPRFRTHIYLGAHTIHDIYYDRDGFLMNQGIYIRKRNGEWEAKIRQGGDYVNSQFRECVGTKAVGEIVKRNIRDLYKKVDENGMGLDMGLDAVAEFESRREEWDVDAGFRIVIDEASFGWRVGEVELCRRIGDQDVDSETLGRDMDRDIGNFMEEYRWAFPVPRGGEKVRGKLSAYFDWKRFAG